MKRIATLALCVVIAAGVLMSAGCREEARKEGHKDTKARITELKKKAMTKTMDLDEATINKVIEVTDKYNQQKISLLKDRRINIEALKTALDSGKATDSDLKSLIDSLNKGEADLFALRQQEETELSTFLTTRQLGLYLVFDDKFKRKIRRHIESERSSNRDKRKGGKDDKR
ncbi:MAG: hypothetical protein JW765_08305 [Deltaproteobacteria bacterium]|nr:hypothetical protein [Candidatus Zymogenaceae bacterium]